MVALLEVVVDQPFEAAAQGVVAAEGRATGPAVPHLCGLHGGRGVAVAVGGVVAEGRVSVGGQQVVGVLEDLDLEVLLEGQRGGMALVDRDHQVFHGVGRTGGAGRPVVAGRGRLVIDRNGRVGERGTGEGGAVALADVGADVGDGTRFEDVVEHLLVHLEPGTVALGVAVLGQRVAVGVGQGQAVVALGSGTGEGDVLVHVIVRLVVLQGLVVGVRLAVAIVGLSAGLVEFEPFVKVEGLRELVQDLGRDIRVIGHAHAAGGAGTLAGGDEDDAVRTAGTVDSRGSTVLQDGDGLDVLGRDVTERTADNTVHDDERGVAAVDGGRATDLVAGGVTAGVGVNVQTGDLTLDEGHGVRSGLVELFGADAHDGGGDLLLVEGTVTDDDGLFNHFGVFLEGDPRRNLRSDIGDRLIADAADLDDRAGTGDAEDIVAVRSGSGTVGGAALDDRCTDNGTDRIRNDASHFISGLGGHADRHGKKNRHAG